MLGTEDPSSFCEQVRPRLVGSLTLYLGDRGVAEEIAQEALARAWERWATVGQMDHPEAWTFRTGMNLAGSWFRRRAAERRANRRVAAERADDGPDAAMAEAVRSAVSGLPDRQRASVVARYFLGLSVAETAALLGCAQGTVKAATHQALANLRAGGLLRDEPADEAADLADEEVS
jgi:RNA polymerase sigma-70 factor (ECF subfamily)